MNTDTRLTLRPRLAAASLATLLLLTLLGTAMLLAQGTPPPEAPRVFGEVIDVRVVNVEAVVTDRQGNRVYGLGPEDFRLFVDGREVSIDYFTEVQGGQAMPAEEADQDTAPTTLPSLRAGEAVGLSYLVFIDDFYTIKNRRNQILERVREQLPRLRAEDRMAVVAFDGRSLDMLTTWSSSVDALERVFDEAMARRAYGVFRRTERFAGFGRVNSASGIEEIANLERRVQFERITKAVVSTLRSFAMPEGRKVMMMITGEWPAASFFESYGQGSLSAGDTDLELASPIAETANLLGYTLYPIDTVGIQATGGDVEAVAPNIIQPIEDPTNPFEIVLGPREGGTGLSSEAFRAATLRHLAHETGGRALLTSNRFDPLPAIAEDTGSFYWLGFNVDRQRDNRHHRIRVELRNPDLELRSRRGFRDLSRPAELAMMTQSALLFGNPLEATVLGIELGSPEKEKWGKMNVPLRVEIPADELTMVPTAEGFTAMVELRVAAKDADGDLSRMPSVPLRLSRPDEPTADTRLRYQTSLKLRRQWHQIVVSVHDLASGNTLTSIAVVDP